MKKPSIPDAAPPVGVSGLPDLGSVDAEFTTTRQTDTNVRSILPAAESSRPALTVLTGIDAGSVVVITGDMAIGRAADCALALSDPGVSRVHARIVRRGEALVIHDVASKNGTYVGDEPVGTAGRTLCGSDVIHLGPQVSVRFAHMSEAEEKLARDLYDSSMRDSLTRAYNRRYLANRLKAEVAYAIRHRGRLSVMTFDFDHFKKVNDTHGHAAGDAILRAGASSVTATLRSEDILARVGGEEFVVVLRGVARGAAMACAERLRSAVESCDVEVDGVSLRATISLGVATSDEVSLDASGGVLLTLADERLYEAKAAGRNRIVGPPAETER